MSIDSIVTLFGVLATIASTIYTIIQTRKAKGYKEKTYRLYLSLDKSMLAERCSQLTIEISNTSGSNNNNKGGKLSSLFTFSGVKMFKNKQSSLYSYFSFFLNSL